MNGREQVRQRLAWVVAHDRSVSGWRDMRLSEGLSSFAAWGALHGNSVRDGRIAGVAIAEPAGREHAP